jgi:hypothetical protein
MKIRPATAYPVSSGASKASSGNESKLSTNVGHRRITDDTKKRRWKGRRPGK